MARYSLLDELAANCGASLKWVQAFARDHSGHVKPPV